MNSNPLTCKTARKRLYFNNFKERLVHFNGTVMLYFFSSAGNKFIGYKHLMS